MKNVLTTIIVIMALLNAKAQNERINLTLKESIMLGIEKNVDVQNAALEHEKAQFQTKETKSKLWPQLEAYSTFNYYYAIPKMIVPGEIFGQTGLIPIEIGTKYDWNNGFKATQILFNKSYFTSLKISKQMETLCDLTLEQQREEISYQVSQIYFLCQNTSKQIELLTRTLSNTENLLRISKAQSENDIIRKTDYSRIQVNKSNIQTQIDHLNYLYKEQLGLLKYLIGLEITSDIVLSDSISFEPFTFIQDSVNIKKRTEIKLLDKQEEITSLTYRSDQQTYLPTISGFGQYYYQGQRNDFDFFIKSYDKFYKVGFVGLNINIPLFHGFERLYKAGQYDIELQKLQNTRKNTIAYFSKEYADAVRQYNLSYTAMVRQKENIKVARDSYKISTESYRQQIIPLSDLLLSESSLIEAQLSYYNALLQLQNAGLELKKSKGELLNF